MTVPTGNPHVEIDQVRLRLRHRHPPAGAFGVALIGLQIDLAECGIGCFPVLRQPSLERTFISAERLRLEIVLI